MVNAAEPTATSEELVAAPPHLIAEIIDARLVTRRYFGLRNGLAVTALRRMLFVPREHPAEAAWQVVLRPELHIGTNVLVPEFAMWNQRELVNADEWRDVETMPRWVCEYITDQSDLDVHAQRCRVYAKAGIRSLWRIDASVPMLQTFDLESTAWKLQQTIRRGDIMSSNLFPGIEINFDNLWPLDSTSSID